MNPTRNILLAGASVRAAAASALRAGFAPWCVDLFADADLARACPVHGVALDQYPRALVEQLRHGPTGPWMYGGGLENHPTLLKIPGRELWGNSADVVRAVRDPARLFEALVDFDMPRLGERGALAPRGNWPPADDVVPRGADVPRSPTESRWLVKPLFGSGGFDVHPWTLGKAVPEDCYLQEWADGKPASAVFVGIEGRSILLGATRQLIGCRWLHAARTFQYAGSIGPLACSPIRLEMLGQTLVETFGLRGLFGVDFLLDGDRIRPLEVNPRYPASLEILERIMRRPLLTDHAEAFVGRVSDPSVENSAADPWAPARSETRLTYVPHAATFHGKAILFAGADIVFPGAGPWNAAFDFALDDLDIPYADLPSPGQLIPRGAPILTFFASAASPEECEAALAKIAGDLDRALGVR